MRDIPQIWATWNSGVYVGDTKPSTRVTVEKGWQLRTTDTVLGTWNKGPARWYQARDAELRTETEIPNVVSVTMNRSVEADAGTCEIVITNTPPPIYGEPELPAGQFGQPGYYTWDRGGAQDARARWGHVTNAWNEVLVPNALIRTYQGFGGTDKSVPDAVADENVVLNGVWLIDDVTVSTDGTLSMKCRDMAKLLLDQQLFPPLVPQALYPIDYRRWIFKDVIIPEAGAAAGDMCFPCSYLNSSTDEVYGQSNSAATGHPGTDAFDASSEAGPDTPGSFAHQRTYWLSEPMGSPSDTVWIEFAVNGGGAGDINQIYYHAWKGAIEGRGVHQVMVSVFENGAWVAPETPLGGITPQGVPYVSTFVPGTELSPTTSTNLYNLPRDYRASVIRLTVTSLIWAIDFPYGYDDSEPREPGYRGGARKIMACFTRTNGDTRFASLVFAGAGIPKNTTNRLGYWQVRANGQVFAFGDARVYPTNSPSSNPASTVIGMSAHPDGNGYWLLDVTGRVVSAGSATHHGDLSNDGFLDVLDLAPAPDGAGYWLLRSTGQVYAFGSAELYGDSVYSATMASGVPAFARSIESHPTAQGYWVLWSDGGVTAHNLTHWGNGFDHTGFTNEEYIPSLRRTSTGNGYWITSGGGRVQAKGDAPHKGNSDVTGYGDGNWFKGISWDLIPSTNSDNGYAIQTADGRLWVRGDPVGFSYGNIGSGKGKQRFDGNYKDYSDIIRDLLLWSGFYLYRTPQASAERPEVYGNIQTTGAYAEDPLPKEMFDKKPVMESIKALKEIVGYLAYVDSEGGFRWEAPNVFTMGNYHIDGTPYMHMPEIDESIQLLGHQVTRSASQARSRLIISSAEPEPQVAGGTIPKGILTTEITPHTKPDLRGLVVPAMWVNGKFLRKTEQKVMADLIDMRSWFSRRTASVSCVANPLIEINDQVRIMERQTGEVYVHYIRGINTTHDLETGDFTMSLTTHWLGGTPYGQSSFYYAAAGMPAGGGYWQATLTGQIYAYGAAQIYERHQADTHLDWVIGLRSTRTGLGYYTLDTSGKILTYGDAVHYGELQRPQKDVIDLALTPSGGGYWVLQETGAVTAFGDATFYGNGSVTHNLPSGAPALASSIESHPTTQGYWVLYKDGEVQAYNLPNYGSANRDGFTSFEFTPCLRATTDGGGYWIPSGGGTIMQVFGDAPNHGAAGPWPDDHWPNSLVWDMIVSPDGGYALQRAEGMLVPASFLVLGASGTAEVSIMWAIVSPEVHAAMIDPTQAFGISSEVAAFLAKTSSPSANNAVVNNFAAPAESVINGSTP